MNKTTFILAIMFLAACSTGKKGVNEPKARPPTELLGMFSSGKDPSSLVIEASKKN